MTEGKPRVQGICALKMPDGEDSTNQKMAENCKANFLEQLNQDSASAEHFSVLMT